MPDDKKLAEERRRLFEQMFPAAPAAAPAPAPAPVAAAPAPAPKPATAPVAAAPKPVAAPKPKKPRAAAPKPAPVAAAPAPVSIPREARSIPVENIFPQSGFVTTGSIIEEQVRPMIEAKRAEQKAAKAADAAKIPASALEFKPADVPDADILSGDYAKESRDLLKKFYSAQAAVIKEKKAQGITITDDEVRREAARRAGGMAMTMAREAYTPTVAAGISALGRGLSTLGRLGSPLAIGAGEAIQAADERLAVDPLVDIDKREKFIRALDTRLTGDELTASLVKRMDEDAKKFDRGSRADGYSKLVADFRTRYVKGRMQQTGNDLKLNSTNEQDIAAAREALAAFEVEANKTLESLRVAGNPVVKGGLNVVTVRTVNDAFERGAVEGLKEAASVFLPQVAATTTGKAVRVESIPMTVLRDISAPLAVLSSALPMPGEAGGIVGGAIGERGRPRGDVFARVQAGQTPLVDAMENDWVRNALERGDAGDKALAAAVLASAGAVELTVPGLEVAAAPAAGLALGKGIDAGRFIIDSADAIAVARYGKQGGPATSGIGAFIKDQVDTVKRAREVYRTTRSEDALLTAVSDSASNVPVNIDLNLNQVNPALAKVYRDEVLQAVERDEILNKVLTALVDEATAAERANEFRILNSKSADDIVAALDDAATRAAADVQKAEQRLVAAKEAVEQTKRLPATEEQARLLTQQEATARRTAGELKTAKEKAAKLEALRGLDPADVQARVFGASDAAVQKMLGKQPAAGPTPARVAEVIDQQEVADVFGAPVTTKEARAVAEAGSVREFLRGKGEKSLTNVESVLVDDMVQSLTTGTADDLVRIIEQQGQRLVKEGKRTAPYSNLEILQILDRTDSSVQYRKLNRFEEIENKIVDQLLKDEKEAAKIVDRFTTSADARARLAEATDAVNEAIKNARMATQDLQRARSMKVPKAQVKAAIERGPAPKPTPEFGVPAVADVKPENVVNIANDPTAVAESAAAAAGVEDGLRRSLRTVIPDNPAARRQIEMRYGLDRNRIYGVTNEPWERPDIMLLERPPVTTVSDPKHLFGLARDRGLSNVERYIMGDGPAFKTQLERNFAEAMKDGTPTPERAKAIRDYLDRGMAVHDTAKREFAERVGLPFYDQYLTNMDFWGRFPALKGPGAKSFYDFLDKVAAGLPAGTRRARGENVYFRWLSFRSAPEGFDPLVARLDDLVEVRNANLAEQAGPLRQNVVLLDGTTRFADEGAVSDRFVGYVAGAEVRNGKQYIVVQPAEYVSSAGPNKVRVKGRSVLVPVEEAILSERGRVGDYTVGLGKKIDGRMSVAVYDTARPMTNAEWAALAQREQTAFKNGLAGKISYDPTYNRHVTELMAPPKRPTATDFDISPDELNDPEGFVDLLKRAPPKPQVEEVGGAGRAFGPKVIEVKSAGPAYGTSIVDESGNPLVVYHGTPNKFDTFSKEQSGGLINFTEDQNAARQYAKGAGGGRRPEGVPDVVDDLGNRYRSQDNGNTWTIVDRATKSAPDSVSSSTVSKEINNGTMFTENREQYVVRATLDAKRPLDLTTTAGTTVIASLDARGNRFAQDIIDQAKSAVARGAQQGEEAVLPWDTTKYEYANRAWENVLVPQLKQQGYDAIRMKDYGHNTWMVFEPDQVKSAVRKTDAAAPDEAPLYTGEDRPTEIKSRSINAAMNNRDNAVERLDQVRREAAAIVAQTRVPEVTFKNRLTKLTNRKPILEQQLQNIRDARAVQDRFVNGLIQYNDLADDAYRAVAEPRRALAQRLAAAEEAVKANIAEEGAAAQAVIRETRGAAFAEREVTLQRQVQEEVRRIAASTPGIQQSFELARGVGALASGAREVVEGTIPQALRDLNRQISRMSDEAARDLQDAIALQKITDPNQRLTSAFRLLDDTNYGATWRTTQEIGNLDGRVVDSMAFAYVDDAYVKDMIRFEKEFPGLADQMRAVVRTMKLPNGNDIDSLEQLAYTVSIMTPEKAAGARTIATGDLQFAQAVMSQGIVNHAVSNTLGLGAFYTAEEYRAIDAWLKSGDVSTREAARGRELALAIYGSAVDTRKPISAISDINNAPAKNELLKAVNLTKAAVSEGMTEGQVAAEVLNAYDKMFNSSLYMPQTVARELDKTVGAMLFATRGGEETQKGWLTSNAFWFANTNKKASVYGLFTPRTEFYFNNLVQDADQVAVSANGGLRQGLKVMIGSTLNNILVAKPFGVPLSVPYGLLDAIRGVRAGTSATGAAEVIARVNNWLGLSAYGTDASLLLRASDDVSRVHGLPYSEMRTIFLEAGGGNTLLADEVVRDLNKAFAESRVSSLFKKVFTDQTDAIGKLLTDRKRAGAFLSLFEYNIKQAGGAARLSEAELRTIARQSADDMVGALMDYSANLHPIERNLVMTVLQPFWAFDKSNTLRVARLLTKDGARVQGAIEAARSGYRFGRWTRGKQTLAQVGSFFLENHDQNGFDVDAMKADDASRAEQMRKEGRSEAEIAAEMLYPRYEQQVRLLKQSGISSRDLRLGALSLTDEHAPSIAAFMDYYVPKVPLYFEPDDFSKNRTPFSIVVADSRLRGLQLANDAANPKNKFATDSMTYLMGPEDSNLTAFNRVFALAEAIAAGAKEAANAEGNPLLGEQLAEAAVTIIGNPEGYNPIMQSIMEIVRSSYGEKESSSLRPITLGAVVTGPLMQKLNLADKTNVPIGIEVTDTDMGSTTTNLSPGYQIPAQTAVYMRALLPQLVAMLGEPKDAEDLVQVMAELTENPGNKKLLLDLDKMMFKAMAGMKNRRVFIQSRDRAAEGIVTGRIARAGGFQATRTPVTQSTEAIKTEELMRGQEYTGSLDVPKYEADRSLFYTGLAAGKPVDASIASAFAIEEGLLTKEQFISQDIKTTLDMLAANPRIRQAAKQAGQSRLDRLSPAARLGAIQSAKRYAIANNVDADAFAVLRADLAERGLEPDTMSNQNIIDYYKENP